MANRSFDSEKIEQYKSSEEYDYFKRVYPQKKKNDETSNNNSGNTYSSNQGRAYNENDPLTFSGWTIAIIIGAVLLVVIVLIALNADGRSSVKSERIKANTIEIEEELDEEEIDKNDFDSMIEKAKSKENFRLAVRLLFLKSLQILNDKKLINYKKNKTNYEYTFEIKDKKTQNMFQNASETFSWVWYGNNAVDFTSYVDIETNFNQLIETIEQK